MVCVPEATIYLSALAAAQSIQTYHRIQSHSKSLAYLGIHHLPKL